MGSTLYNVITLSASVDFALCLLAAHSYFLTEFKPATPELSMDDGAQKKNHNLMETVIIIEGVPEEMSNSRSRGKDRQHDLHFLIHVLGVKRNDITNCYRYGQRTDGKTRPLACELLDKRAFGLWTDYGAMKLVGDYKVQSFKSWYLTKDITLAMTGLESAIRRASLSDSPRSRRAGIVQPPHIILSTGNTIPLSVLNNPSSCLKRLGKGFFGTVYLFKARLNQIAIKEIEIPTSLVPKEGRDVFEEVELQKDLRHPNIIQYYGSYQSEEHICILMEHASNGSLKDLLLKEGRLDDKRVLSFTKQILEGLNYLHTRPRMIIHRDLRSPNVLICDYGRVKIADFGVSKQLNTLATSSGFNTAVGNLFWQAPELLKSDR